MDTSAELFGGIREHEVLECDVPPLLLLHGQGPARYGELPHDLLLPFQFLVSEEVNKRASGFHRVRKL